MGRGDIDVKDLKLKQVYPSSTDSLEDRKIDIILIHGKAAHPFKTWTKQKPEEAVQIGSSSAHKKQYLDWTTQEDWLPSAIPGSRIFRFGYRGDWYGKDAIKTRTSDISTSLLDQIAGARRTCVNRPLLFVAHSYGGLVPAKALADAWHDQTRWPDIYAATVGAVFLGTPFRGTTHLLHLAILPLIQSTDEFVLPEDIKASKADNDWLHDMFSDFCKSIRESVEDVGKAPAIACYFEREPTDLSFYLRNSKIAAPEISASTNQYRDIVVSESSACLDNMSSMLDIRRFSRACDHLNLHRFTDLEDEEWKTFKRVLQEFASNRPRLSKSYREKLIASLRYENMGKRHASVPEPCKGTYSWIYKKAEDDAEDYSEDDSEEDFEEDGSEDDRREWHSFDAWLRNNDPTYWISGRAGSGKSVLLARIVDDEKTLQKLKSWSGQANVQLLSFFFWKPGTGLENSVQGLLQSFLYQLCNFEPAVIMFQVVKELHLKYGQLPSWSVSRLTRVLHTVLRATETTRRYCLFIDGLDEFTGDQDKLLEFVLSLRFHKNVKCCVSSRPEQTFEDALRGIPRLRLEDLNYDDISLFVQLTLRKARTEDRKEFVEQICSRAEGVFLWAALVTKDLVRGIKAHDEHDVLLSRIEKLPSDLGDLYRRMLESVDMEHKSFLAFYIQCLRLPPAKIGLFTSISILTADRLKNIPASYKDFAAECEVTAIQIRTHAGGLLEVSEFDETNVRWVTRLEKLEFEWVMAPEAGAENRLKTRRVRAQSVHHISALRSEARQLKWVHRSAYDFTFESHASQELDLPDMMEVFARLWRAALTYIKIAPSVHMSHAVWDHVWYSSDLYSSTSLRIKQMLGLARWAWRITSVQLQELLDVVTDLDIGEFSMKDHLCIQCGKRFRDIIRRVLPILTTPAPVMFWILSGESHFSSVIERCAGPLSDSQEASLAAFLLISIISWVTEDVEPSVRELDLFRLVGPVEPTMRYFAQRSVELQKLERVTHQTIIAANGPMHEVLKYTMRTTPPLGCDSDHEVGLKYRHSSFSSGFHGLQAVTCVAIACAWWAWSQRPYIPPSNRHDYLRHENIHQQHFPSYSRGLAFSFMSHHCPKLYIDLGLDHQISQNVERISRQPDEERNLRIAQAVNLLDAQEFQVIFPMEEHDSKGNSFWEIKSDPIKRTAITAEYELRAMAEPARQAGKSLQDFWGPGSDAFAAYRAAQGRYKEFIDRAFEVEIQRRRNESGDANSESECTKSEPGDTKSELGDTKSQSSVTSSPRLTNRLLSRWRLYIGLPIRL